MIRLEYLNCVDHNVLILSTRETSFPCEKHKLVKATKANVNNVLFIVIILFSAAKVRKKAECDTKNNCAFSVHLRETCKCTENAQFF